ncbi:MAG: CDP-alcohol phosphatidyltransferase family protein [Micrococcaceae bacterium]
MTVIEGKDVDEEEVVPNLFTWPNLVTLFRFLLVPYFSCLILAKDNLSGAFWLLVFLGSTDWIDGFLARRLHQVSTWGQLLDPLADRVSLVIIAFTLAAAGIATWSLLAAIIIPDIIIFLFGITLLKGKPDLEVTYLGKVRTALLLVSIPFLILVAMPQFKHSILESIALTLVTLGCIGHWGAGIQYLQQCIETYKHQQYAKNQTVKSEMSR